MNSRVIFVVGLPGVGKSEFAIKLAHLTGMNQVNAGDVLRAHMRKRDVVLTDIIRTGDVFIDLFGEIAVGEVILSEMRAHSIGIIDGVRLHSTFQHFKNSDVKVDIVYLETEETMRKSRFGARSIAEGEATFENFENILAQKDIWAGDLPKFREACSWRFDNSGNREALFNFAQQVASDWTST